jgi:hypothetical protein
MTLTVSQVDSIAAETDPVLRNLAITVAYSRLATDFAERVDRRNLSWCTFGAWASEGVGGAIRHHHTDKTRVLRLLRGILPHRYPTIAENAAAAFARGNQSVFGHIGRAFAGFHEAVDDPAPGAMARFLATLPDEPATPEVDVRFDPPVGLAAGFELYDRARAATDERCRAQLIAAANLRLACVEQTRLQEPIEAAFSCALSGRWARRHVARWLVARLFTETALSMRLGDEVVRPRSPLPDHDGRRWPADLVELDAALFEPFAAVLPAPGTSRAPDSKDWTSLRDRLRYTAALMRSRQQADELVGRCPFEPDVVADIDAGVVPASLTPKVDR